MARCATCAAHKETIKALRDALAAKDQAITVMADTIDSLRMAQPPQAPDTSHFAALLGDAQPQASIHPLFVPDEQEEIIASLESGDLSQDDAERELARLQALNP